MIQTKTNISLSRLIITSRGNIVFDEIFHKGVNIIRGTNSSGKSTIADFLFFALGGDVTKWKPEAEQCDFVVVEVSLSGTTLTLRREISSSSHQGMSVFWGSYEESVKSGAKGWELYPYQRSTHKQSFSQILFNILGIPEVRSDADNNITMHQLLRLIYIDQLSSVQSLLRDEMFDNPLTRRTIADLLLGLYDDLIFQNELLLRETSRRAESVKEQISALKEVFKEIDQVRDNTAILISIKDIESQLEKVRATLKNYDSISSSNNDKIKNKIESCRNAYISKQSKLNKLIEEIHLLETDIDDSQSFLMALESRIVALDQSSVTRDSLKDIRLTHCPVCLNLLETNDDPLLCSVCKLPLTDKDQKSSLARMKQEIVFQIKETKSLLLLKFDKLEALKRNTPQLKQEVLIAKAKLNDEISRIRTKRNHELDEMLVKQGQLESELLSLHKESKSIAVLSNLQDQQFRLSSQIRDLYEAIESKRNKQSIKTTKAYSQIYKNVKKLLVADLPREEIFEDPNEVLVDFNKNTFSVNGRNQFSASSIVYLKNCVHYAIFFASLDLDFFRYPRFIICDNMEDKGMEQERSHNFQEILVDIAKEYKDDFQIIFTTSMISPKLENSPLCIGDHYTQENKSLKI